MTEFRRKIIDFLRSNGLPGKDEDLLPEHQVFLLGGNPLPIRIALEALCPLKATVLATRETIDSYYRIEQQKPDRTSMEPVILEDSSSRENIIIKLKPLIENNLMSGRPVGIHYTGGKKTMAAHSLTLFQEIHTTKQLDVPFHRCTYLDGESDQLVFDNLANRFPLCDIPISLERILALHAMKIKTVKSDINENRKIISDEIAGIAFKEEGIEEYRKTLPRWEGWTICAADPSAVINNETKEKLYPESIAGGRLKRIECRAAHETNFKSDGAFANWSFKDVNLLCPSITADSTWKSLMKRLEISKPHRVAEYLSNLWFEDWLLSRILKIPSWKFDETCMNLEVLREQSNTDGAELDIVARIGHTLVVISATMANGKHLAKQKYLEVAARASQIGGDFTRFVIAYWGKEDSISRVLWSELVSHWHAPDNFRVLSLPHYRGESAFTHQNAMGQDVSETFDDMFSNWFKR